MKKMMRKSLSLLLALVLCCALPISAFAEGESVPEAEAEPVVEEVAVDFSGDNVPSVSVTVTPGSTNTGSADASDVLEEAAKEEVEQIKNNLPDSGYVDNGDGTHSITSNAPIYGKNGEIIGYNTTTITQSNDPTVEGEMKTEKETVQPTEADRNVTASMSEVTNNGSGDPADWEMQSITPTVVPDTTHTVDEEKDLRIIIDQSAMYTGPLEDLDWENHAFAYIKPSVGSQICVDMVTAPSGLPFEGPGIYELQNEKGEKFYAYCMDASVLAAAGHPYDMLNVEDADYLSDEDAKHVRYIVENGYWGTESKTDEEGNLVIEEGSLDAMKDLMTNATDENGEKVFTEEEIALLTDGLALSVTQAAIWYYGNSGKDSYKVDDENIIGSGAVFTGAYYNSIKVSNKTEEVKAFEETNNKTLQYAPDGSKLDDETIALAQKLFEFMLEGTKEATDDTTAFTADNAFTSATITVNNQVSDDLNALAENAPKNYDVDVAFSLGVVPGEGDSLKVEIYQLDADGNVVMNGDKPVVLSSVAVETGKTDYKVEGLELPNGSSITLNLSGVNELDKGVYLYSAVSFLTSQTMVGYASGDQAVDLSVDLSFHVDEPELRKEKTVSTSVYVTPDPYTPPQEEEEIPDEDPPLEDIPEEEPPLEDIFEEEVPLADVPHTGDNSVCFVILAVLSAMGLAVLALTRKREEA